jgi:KaiC/GvpD/RAD55 family RecA-like ATPase
MAAGRLRTGMEILDRRLDGGIPPGSIVALVAEPSSQAELLLYQLTDVRGSLYLTTERDEQAAQDAIRATQAPVGDPTVRGVTGSEPLDRASKLIRALPEEANLIVDTVDPLERSERDRYRTFINEVRNHMVTTGSLAFLHCLDGNEPPPNRDTTEHMADVVFDLETSIRGTDLVNRLSVPKFRGGSALTDTIKLELTDQVAVDTSRDIA